MTNTIMAKEKLFTPEDFDKPSGKSKGKKTAVIIALILVALGLLSWGIVSWTSKTDTEETTQSPISQTTENNEPGEAIDTIDSATEEVSTTVEESSSLTVETAQPNKETLSANVSGVSSDIEKEAYNVIRGDYGNVPERRRLLGTQYQAIQNRVNELKKLGVF